MADLTLKITTEENAQFQRITNGAYWIGLLGHGSAPLLFYLIDLKELMFFNIFFSAPAFALAIILNKRGKHSFAFTLAFTELLVHQVLASYFLGWDIGAHFWLIYLAGLCFFNPSWKNAMQFTLLGFIVLIYIGLFFFSQNPVYPLAEQQALYSSIGNAVSVITILSILINFYAKSTHHAQQQVKKMATKVEALLEQQVSQEIAHEIIGNTQGSGHKEFDATVMFMDIRNFTNFADAHTPEEVSKFQNTVFSELLDIIQNHHGVVVQLLGDGLMAVFGAPVPDNDHAKNAVKAGYEILDCIDQLSRDGLIPATRIGMGLNSGTIIAGNIGNNTRQSYSLTGKNVIIAARLEGLNKQFQSQFLVAESVVSRAQEVIRAKEDLGYNPLKGIEQEIQIFQLA